MQTKSELNEIYDKVFEVLPEYKPSRENFLKNFPGFKKKYKGKITDARGVVSEVEPEIAFELTGYYQDKEIKLEDVSNDDEPDEVDEVDEVDEPTDGYNE